ncbi:MAG: hypothetical protein K9G44_04410, partial [Melioribacteraceae bacterium]|nr:hypothetical protein [Melioribacteraceae bacterium]
KEYKNNMGVFREVNGESVELNQELKTRIGNGINSVIYFASLPYPLNDKAAVKEYIGMANMKDQPYYVVEVTFKAEGGGEDFEDRYVYWFHEETFSMDYLAYYFRVNGGGSRFRIMHNKRMINGITFTDHENYKSDEIGDNVEDYDTLFNNANIEKVSDINLENVSVEILK